jgi:DNA-binding transcriptional ArsR family regulator
MPSAVAPLTPVGDLPIEAQIAALRANHGDRLRDDVARLYPDRIPAVWEPALDDPAGWSRAFGDVVSDVWSAVGKDAWQRSRPVLDSEFRRIGMSVARGDHRALFNALSPRISYVENAFLLDRRVRVPVDGRQIVLAPMISAPGSMVVERDDPTAVIIGYAVPRSLQWWDAGPVETTGTHDALAAVIGRGRADLLRRLDRQATMSQLAADLGCAPSTVTHHCASLEAAGLIERVRRGKTIWVWRTPRGSELLDLFN